MGLSTFMHARTVVVVHVYQTVTAYLLSLTETSIKDRETVWKKQHLCTKLPYIQDWSKQSLFTGQTNRTRAHNRNDNLTHGPFT
jgi:hypothetical protein